MIDGRGGEEIYMETEMEQVDSVQTELHRREEALSEDAIWESEALQTERCMYSESKRLKGQSETQRMIHGVQPVQLLPEGFHAACQPLLRHPQLFSPPHPLLPVICINP